MIAMIFAVWPKSEHRQDYLDTAAVLRPLLGGIEGFVSSCVIMSTRTSLPAAAGRGERFR